MPCDSRPIYTSSLNGVTYTSDQYVASDLREALEQIFFTYQARPSSTPSWHLL